LHVCKCHVLHSRWIYDITAEHKLTRCIDNKVLHLSKLSPDNSVNTRIRYFSGRPSRSYRKIPGLSEKRYAGLTYSILTITSFIIVSLGRYTAILSFFPQFKSTVELIFFNDIEYRLHIPLDVRHRSKTSSLQFHFQLRKRSEITGG
jgi:hypothetical protein